MYVTYDRKSLTGMVFFARLKALRDIEPDEELTFDYGQDYCEHQAEINSRRMS